MSKKVHVNICDEVLKGRNLKHGDTLRWINNKGVVCVVTMPNPNPLDQNKYTVAAGSHVDAKVTGNTGTYNYHADCCKPLHGDPRLIVV
jgi:plastocyanin